MGYAQTTDFLSLCGQVNVRRDLGAGKLHVAIVADPKFLAQRLVIGCALWSLGGTTDFDRLMVVSALIVGVGLNHLARQKYNSLEISDE